MIYFAFLSLFSLAFMCANILGGKILSIYFLPITSGTLVYPLTFFISDLVTEVYGETKARLMVGSGFFASLIAFTIQYQQNGNVRLSSILILSSLIAFVTSQLLDIRIFSWIKKITSGHHLWLRNQLSTYISQFIDTCIVNGLLLLWGLGLSYSEAYPIFLGNLVYKMFFTIAMVPLLYALVVKLNEKTS